jgi:type IV secretory pathway TrbD component
VHLRSLLLSSVGAEFRRIVIIIGFIVVVVIIVVFANLIVRFGLSVST